MTTENTIVKGAYAPVTFTESGADRALDLGKGIVRLAPTWVPRTFCTPGGRIRLHPDDYYSFGAGRGGIDERWLSSATRADNGPLTGPHEGISLVVDPGGDLIPFDEFVAHHKGQLIGDRIWAENEQWPMFSKFFDNGQALPFHFHHSKPEAYYYSPHMNNHLGRQPISFLGLQPQVTRAEVREKLEAFGRGGDNHITDLAYGYRTRLGTGWDIPSGVLHAPASVCTYEPQAACDVLCMCESWSNNREVPEELMWKDVPPDKVGDFDSIVEQLDWATNVDPDFVKNRCLVPHETEQSAVDGGAVCMERWIVYRSEAFSAKELTIRPGCTTTITDTDAYGAIVVQGHGAIGVHRVAAATLVHYGQLTEDEFFVSEPAAREGVRVVNDSRTDDLVMLKHFGPGNQSLALA